MLVMALSTFAQILPRVIFLDEILALFAGISLTPSLCEVLVSSDVVIAFTLLSTAWFRRLLASVDSVGCFILFCQCILSCLCKKWLS